MSRWPDRRPGTVTAPRASAEAAADPVRLGHECGHGTVRVRPFGGAGKRAQHPVEAKAVDLRQHLAGPGDRETEGVSPPGIGFAEPLDRGTVV